MNVPTDAMTQERLDSYIDAAAKAAAYTEGFGVRGCDLVGRKDWSAVYIRQSLEEQAKNDRLAEYLFTCAKLAKQKGCVIPRDYILYDIGTSENMNRPRLIRLRQELILPRQIAGVIIPTQGRLTDASTHQGIFDDQCEYYGVEVIYGDAPSGNDWASKKSRSDYAFANALRVKTNQDSALAGQISRVLAGKVPALRASLRASYGYYYRTVKQEDPRSRRTMVLQAWWEINELGPDNEVIYGSPAWVIIQIFIWIGDEYRTAYWVASKLNELKIKPPVRASWSPKTVIKLVSHKCYTGQGEYNANGRVPNPDRPLGDVTMGIKRTLVRPKPPGAKVTFKVPALITEEQWVRANTNLRERGRGRGKQGKAIPALFRARMICPVCKKPMSVKRGKKGEVYYYCRAHHCPWITDPCQFTHFVPKDWDKQIWDELCDMLRSDTWVDQQLTAESHQNEAVYRQIRLQEMKIHQIGEDTPGPR